MKLTKYDKSSFVNAVMNDVPEVDYNEQVKVIMLEWIVSKMPPSVLKVWNDKKTKGYMVQNHYYLTPPGLNTFFGPEIIPVQPLPTNISEELKKLGELSQAQRRSREDLNDKVSSLIEPCTTLNKAYELLTENFHKYLPADRDGIKTKNVPAVRDTVKALKDAGWPIKK